MWRNALFIDNLYPQKFNQLYYCYGWGWYLSNDFQMFIVSMIPMLIYNKLNRKSAAKLLILALIVSQWIAFLVFNIEHKLNLSTFS